MITVVQIKILLKTDDPAHFLVITLIGEHRVPDGARTRHIVIGDSNEVACVPFVQEFDNGTGGKNGKVIGVRLNGRQDFAEVRLSRNRPLNHQITVSKEISRFAGARDLRISRCAPKEDSPG
jgi:hypothetical protein